MTNTKTLWEEIDKCGYKLRFVAKKVGVSYQGFLNKARNKSEFKASEIQGLCDLLHLSAQQKEEIFFCNKSR